MRKNKSQNTILLYIPLILQTIVWIPTRIVLSIFLRLKISGTENLRNLGRSVIFAVNHSSELDPIVVPAALPLFSRFMPMFYTSREREFYGKTGFKAFFYGGFFFKIWGAYPVHVGIKNYAQSLKDHIEILERKKGSICIFPEGRKTKDGKMREARGGVAFLVGRTETPVVPVTINNIFGITAKDFFLRKKRVSIIFGKPMMKKEVFNPVSPSLAGYKQASQKIMRRIAENQTPHAD